MNQRTRMLIAAAGLAVTSAVGCGIDIDPATPGGDGSQIGTPGDPAGGDGGGEELAFPELGEGGPAEGPGEPGGRPGDPVVEPGSVGVACDFGGAGGESGAGERAVLAVDVAGEVRFVYADGSWATVYERETAEDGSAYGVQLEAEGGLVVTSGILPIVDAENGYWEGQDNRSALLDADGNVRWEQQIEASETPYYGGYVLHMLGADGTTITPLLSGFAETDASGATTVVAGLRPLGAVVEGLAPVVSWVAERGVTVHGWYDAELGELLEVAEAVDGRQGAVSYLGTAFVVPEVAEGAPRLRVERPTGATSVELPGEYAAIEALVRWGSGGDWLLVAPSVESGEGDLVNLATGAVRHVALVLPEGLRLLDSAGYYGYEEPTRAMSLSVVDEAGGILLALRDDESGAVYRTADGGATWARVGERFTAVGSAHAEGRGGAYLVGTTELSPYYYYGDGPESWVEGGESVAVRGNALQVVHAASGRTTVLEGVASHMARLDQRGDCAAYWEFDESGTRATFVVLNAATGEQTALWEAPSDGVWSQLFDWFD